MTTRKKTTKKQAARPVDDVTLAWWVATPADLQPLGELECVGTVLNHPQLRSAIKAAKLTHRTPGLQIWTGAAGVGKTVAAQQLTAELERDAQAEQNGAFRAGYFETGGDVDHGSQRQMKRGVYAAYEVLVGELTTAELRQKSERLLATEVVLEARLANLQMLIIDEAGTKTAPEIRGLAFICDVARRMKWPLSIVLLGMDDLAAKVTSLPVLTSRIRYPFVFTPWTAAETLAYMMSRSSHLANRVTEQDEGVAALVHAVMSATGGRMREVESLMPELDARLRASSANLQSAIDATLSWREDSMTEALLQAGEYKDRVRLQHSDRSARRSRRSAA